MENYVALVELILPSLVLEHFEISNLKTTDIRLDIYLDEKYILPEGYERGEVLSKGFTPANSIQDFPVRNLSTYLHFRRRKWQVIKDYSIISRKIKFTNPGTRMTKEFASFLKDYLNNYAISCNTLEKFYHINGEHFGRQFKNKLSDYTTWDQASHAEDWIVYPENIGPNLSLDETSLSKGELYTILTNKAAKGKKGSLVAMVKGTKSSTIIDALDNIPDDKCDKVKEITLDMAQSMRKIAIYSFPHAQRVIDRFHVQKLVHDALQKIRIRYRWEAIEQENTAMRESRIKGDKFAPTLFLNGDSLRQLLARSRYLLFKPGHKWTPAQADRAKILFAQYPDLQKAYSLAHSLRMIFSNNSDKGVARLKLAKWYHEVERAGFKSFRTVVDTMENHSEVILNYFDNRSTNASAESFNAKLKAFRANLRGVSDINFFLYRVAKIYS